MSQSYEKVGRREAIRRGLPVCAAGLTLYPIKMSHYEDFLTCKDAIVLRLSSLPVKYLTQDYFSALFSFEIDSYQATRKRIGLLPRVMHFFELSLRMEKNKEDARIEVEHTDQNGRVAVTNICVTTSGETVKITPIEFSNVIRPILAELNGLELPDESQNIDLVIAYEQKKMLSEEKRTLHTSTDDLIASVAYHSHCRERDICDWTVREFELRRAAIDRDKRYSMYGQAEMSGMVSFKNGNPAPSWCYDLLDESMGTQSLSELNFGGAKQKTQ